MKGPAGYGRYNDDLECIGCPWAKSDMTPCMARDGSLVLSSGAIRVCVGCGHTADFLVKDLAAGYEPARDLPPAEPEQAASRFAELVRAATEPKESPC